MKKGIEWLKKEIATEMIQLEPNRKERWSDVRYQTLRDVAQKIDQLDEPEVLSQELPVVPTWFDEWWKDIPKGEGNLLHNIAQFHDKLYSSETREVGVYIEDSGNKKKLLNIIINELDYKVEEEQKYFVSSRESIGFWFLTKDNDGDIAIGTNKDYYDRKWESLKLTEEEIKDYDSRYWAFAVKV